MLNTLLPCFPLHNHIEQVRTKNTWELFHYFCEAYTARLHSTEGGHKQKSMFWVWYLWNLSTILLMYLPVLCSSFSEKHKLYLFKGENGNSSVSVNVNCRICYAISCCNQQTKPSFLWQGGYSWTILRKQPFLCVHPMFLCCPNVLLSL